MALGDDLRREFEGGIRYPETFPGVLNTYGGSTRALAADLDVAEGRPDRDPRSTQRSLQRYLRGERHPNRERESRMRGLARGRIAGRRLSAFRSRGAMVVFHGFIRISKSKRYIQKRFALGPEQLRKTLDAAEMAMRTGRGWGRAANAFNEAVFEDAYGIGEETEVLEVERLEINPL